VSRIRKGYEARFRALLQRANARRLEAGVQWLIAKANRLSISEGIHLAAALARIYEGLASHPYFRHRKPRSVPIRFFCDAGLGGLARWLRAAGHDALWRADIDDDELLREARKNSATILTTDSMLMERRLLRDGVIPAFWLPPTLKIPQQLNLVFREFALKVGEPRCMACGGELVTRNKEATRERIPPKTYRWLDEYFECSRCAKLFWRGTHWERISKELHAAAI
jgi:uncharacterized protein with PIN domain